MLREGRTGEALLPRLPPERSEEPVQEVGAAIGIVKTPDQPPKSLFKYFGHTIWPVETARENPAFKLLENLTIKVTPPCAFNDPFEFTPVFSNQVTREEAGSLVGSHLAIDAKKRGLPPEFAAHLAKVVLSLKKTSEDLNFTAQQTVLPRLSDQYGVVCFSEADDEPLMWTHYAAQHHGVMLEFDPKAPLFCSDGFVRVTYAEERVRVVSTSDHKFEQTVSLASQKSPAWAYECEWRLVVPLDKTQKVSAAFGNFHLLKIEPAWIRSITVGLRASLETKAEVNKLVRRPELAHLHSRRYRMAMDSTTFRLRRERVTAF